MALIISRRSSYCRNFATAPIVPPIGVVGPVHPVFVAAPATEVVTRLNAMTLAATAALTILLREEKLFFSIVNSYQCSSMSLRGRGSSSGQKSNLIWHRSESQLRPDVG